MMHSIFILTGLLNCTNPEAWRPAIGRGNPSHSPARSLQVRPDREEPFAGREVDRTGLRDPRSGACQSRDGIPLGIGEACRIASIVYARKE